MTKLTSDLIIEDIANELRGLGKTIVTTNGTFDLLHVGHLDSLEFAKNLGDILIVGVNSDESVKRYKGELRPFIPVDERVRMLAALECVDYVVIFDQDTPVELLTKIKPAIHCKGSEYSDGSRPIPEKEVVESFGGRVEFVNLTINKSTTNIVAKILSTKL